MHIYLPARYPYVSASAHQPRAWNAAQYRAMCARVGIERTVVVQPAAYGTDNRCTVDAVAALGGQARGVATVGADVSTAELERLTAAGMRGARFFMLPGGVVPWEALTPVAERVAPYGWHVQLQLDGRELPARMALLEDLPCDLVVDHVGKFLELVPPTHEAFQALLRLVSGGRCWVKLSAPYETSRSGAPAFGDVGALARALIAEAPQRMLWATNWPHPGEPDDAKPDEAMLLDTLLHWCDDDETRKRILVDNPARLYGF